MAQQIKYDSPSLTRFVYDGSQLVQEILFDVEEVETDWVYTYNDLTRDYLRQPGGIRQRERSGGNDTDYFMTANAGTLEFKTERDPVAETYARNEHTSSMDQLPSSTFADISNLMTSNGYIEMYGGTTAGDTAGFDPLVQMGGRHYLGGLGREINTHPGEFQSITYPMSDDPYIMVDSPPYSIGEVDVIDDPSIISGILNNGSRGGVLNPQDIVTPQFGISNVVGCNGDCVNDFVSLSVPVEGARLNFIETSNEFYQFNVISSGISISSKPGSAVPIPIPPVSTGCIKRECYVSPHDCITKEICIKPNPLSCYCACKLEFEYDLYYVDNLGGHYMVLSWCIVYRRLVRVTCRDLARDGQYPCHGSDNKCPPGSRVCANIRLNTAKWHLDTNTRDKCIKTCMCLILDPNNPQTPQQECSCTDAKKGADDDCNQMPRRIRPWR